MSQFAHFIRWFGFFFVILFGSNFALAQTSDVCEATISNMGYTLGLYSFQRGGLFSNDRHIFGDIVCEVSPRGEIRKIEKHDQILAEDGIFGLGAIMLRNDAEKKSASRISAARQARDQAIEAARLEFEAVRMKERTNYTEIERVEKSMIDDLLQDLRHGVLNERAALHFEIPPDFFEEFEEDKFLKALREKRAEERLAEQSKIEEASHAREAQARAAAEQRDTKIAAEKAAKVTSYVAQLDRELAALPNVSIASYTGSVDRIKLAIIVLGAWALVYEQGADLPLDAVAQQKRQRFRELLLGKQKEMLPALRDAYGPALRQLLAEAGGSARTIGTSFRTIEFVNSAFVRDANTQALHNEIRENLLMLRFTRAQYKAARDASEYRYFTLDSPQDTELVIWESGARFRILR